MNFEYLVLHSPSGYDIELVTDPHIPKAYRITDPHMMRGFSRSKRLGISVIVIPLADAQALYINLVDVKGWEVLEGKMI